MDETQIVEELLSLGVATREQIEAAAGEPSAWRTLPSRLVELGFPRDDVLAAVSSALKLAPAPPSVLRSAAVSAETPVPLPTWREWLACPLVAADGVVLLTTSLTAVTDAQANGVTPARVFVALELDIADLLDREDAKSANDGLVVHDAMGQVGMSVDDGDALGLPGAPVPSAADPSPAPASGDLELDFSGRSPGTGSFGFGGVEGNPATPSVSAPPPPAASSIEVQDSPSGSTRALPSPEADDSMLDRVARGGEQLCGYEIFEELGRGASAVVFRARRPGESYDVALKVITQETAKNPSFPQRFKREIRSQASLTHANIVRVIDFGREGGWYYLATEYLPGGTLEDLVAQSGPLPGPVAACLLSDILQGIAFAQTRGIVHRDLKPGNLLLGSDGKIKIGDFGLARMDLDPNKSSFGAVQGTPAYMSPEQALGLDIDGRSDLFTLATILYELLTGTNPYRREQGPATLMAVAQARSLTLFDVLPSIPLELDEAVYRMSHKELTRRAANAEELLALLAPLVDATTRRWPGLVASYFANAIEVRDQLTRQLALDEVGRARAALATQDEKLRPRAALAVARALSHRADLPEAHELWAELAAAGFTKGAAQKPDLVTVEQQVEDAPEDPRVLRRASELSRGEGNVVKQAAYLRRYLRLGQKDTLAQHQLSLLLSDDERVSSAPVPTPSSPVQRIATPATLPNAMAAPPVTSPDALASQAPGTTSPPAPAQQAVPSSRAPRVVGTGIDAPAPAAKRSGGGLTALLSLILAFIAVGAVWFLFEEEIKAQLFSVAEEKVDEQHQDEGDAPVVVNPFERRQREALAAATAHVAAGALAEAIDAYTRAIDLDPGSKLAMQARLARAEANLKRGERAAATAQYRQIYESTSSGQYGHDESKAALGALGVTLD